MEKPPRLVLSYEDKASPTWKKLTAHLQARLERARLALESPFGDVETARLRGRIEEIRDLMRLEDGPPSTQ